MHRFSLLAAMVFLLPLPAAACETQDGEALVRPLKAPVAGDGVKMTSPFGMLFHPLLGEIRMHTGVDWEAKGLSH
jgi:murein DD-endopeptidase MepM/ murein hydrolase activator NlpD